MHLQKLLSCLLTEVEKIAQIINEITATLTVGDRT